MNQPPMRDDELAALERLGRAIMDREFDPMRRPLRLVVMESGDQFVTLSEQGFARVWTVASNGKPYLRREGDGVY